MTNANNNSAELSAVVMQYETLRRAGFGDAVPPETRAGLLLFLRRGLCGWARALATITALPEPIGSRASSWKAPDEYRTIIHIFAAMAIKANY